MIRSADEKEREQDRQTDRGERESEAKTKRERKIQAGRQGEPPLETF